MRLALAVAATLALAVPLGCGGSAHKQTSAAPPTATSTQPAPTTTTTATPSAAARLDTIRNCVKAAGYDVSDQNTPLTDHALFVDVEAVSIYLFGSPAEARRQLPAAVNQIADPRAKTKVVGSAIVSYSGLRLAEEPDYISKNGAKIEGCVAHA